MFGKDELQKLVDVSGAALETEDRFIAGCTSVNRSLYADGRPGGLLRFSNERYFQFVTARALLSNFPFAVEIERKTSDIVLYGPAHDGTRGNKVAVGEMKHWLSSTGKSELPRIRADVDKLKKATCPGFLLIFTAGRPQELEQSLRWLEERLRLPHEQAVKPYAFRTIGWPSQETKFLVLGYLINPGTPEP